MAALTYTHTDTFKHRLMLNMWDNGQINYFKARANRILFCDLISIVFYLFIYLFLQNWSINHHSNNFIWIMVHMRSTWEGWKLPLPIWQLTNTVTEEQGDLHMNANQIKPKLELHACILMQWISVSAVTVKLCFYVMHLPRRLFLSLPLAWPFSQWFKCKTEMICLKFNRYVL